VPRRYDPIDNCLDGGVQSGDVPTAGQNSDSHRGLLFLGEQVCCRRTKVATPIVHNRSHWLVLLWQGILNDSDKNAPDSTFA